MNNKKKKVVVITGFTGMDGSNLTDFLLKNTDCLIYGMVRRTATPNLKNVEAALKNPRVKRVYGDLNDYLSIEKLVKELKPDYLVNLGANSYVAVSWDMPIQVFETNVLGCLYCLEAIRRNKPDCRFYQASSSEMFGEVQYSPQDISHPFLPQSPYGASKCSAHLLVRVYRESYKLYAVGGILYNHEGVRRGTEFVTRKITTKVAEIFHSINYGKEFEPLFLGNLNARRDWSDSEDFVEGIWLMLNQDTVSKNWTGKPKDYILASGETHSVRNFVELAFKSARIEGLWSFIDNNKKPENEVFIHNKLGSILVKVDSKFYRPAEVDVLCGNSSLAKSELNWQPKTSFKELVGKMVNHDIRNFSF